MYLNTCPIGRMITFIWSSRPKQEGVQGANLVDDSRIRSHSPSKSPETQAQEEGKTDIFIHTVNFFNRVTW